MSLMFSSVFTYDTDAGNYIQAVEAADEADTPGIGALEPAVRQAINNFVVGCKQDGIWDAIKASCILAGAKTLEGSFIDLKSATKILTNNNFADGTYVGSNYTTGDYNRKTGLLGDGSTKYLDSNRALNADPQNSFHMGFYASAGVGLMGRGDAVGDNMIRGDNAVRARSAVSYVTQSASAPYYIAVSRSDSASFRARVKGSSFSFARSSANTDTSSCMVFLHNNFYANGRLAFYSIGESLDLALLDGRVTDLINKFAEVIP